MQAAKRQSLKGDYHVLTVRMQSEEFKHLKRAQARMVKEGLRKISFTAMIVNQIRKLPV
jgi:hypothetical protein